MANEESQQIRGGSVVKRLRTKRGLSQQQLAIRLGWDKSRISKIETGKHGLTLPVIKKLGEALSIDPAVFALACLNEMFPSLRSTPHGKLISQVIAPTEDTKGNKP